MSNVEQLPAKPSTDRPAPRRIMRPCDFGLISAVQALETQVGTVEAYNRLCDAAAQLKAQIDRGEAKIPYEKWSTDPDWIYPRGFRP